MSAGPRAERPVINTVAHRIVRAESGEQALEALKEVKLRGGRAAAILVDELLAVAGERRAEVTETKVVGHRYSARLDGAGSGHLPPHRRPAPRR